MKERDLTDQEMIQIGSQLFPDADPQQIIEYLDSIRQEIPDIKNSDILNVVVHMVVDKQGGNSGKMSGLRQLLGNR